MYQKILLGDWAAIEILDEPEYPGAGVPARTYIKLYMRMMIGYYAVIIDLKKQTVQVVPDLKGWKVIREEIPHPD